MVAFETFEYISKKVFMDLVTTQYKKWFHCSEEEKKDTHSLILT